MLKFSKSTPNSFVTASPLDESTRETLASRREATEEVNNALRSYFKTASKQRDVPNEKRKALPVEIVGEAMLRAESTPMHTQQLKHVGAAHIKLATLQTKFLDDFEHHLRTLEAKGLEQSDFARTLKEMEKRRDQYENAITKAKKSKKEEGEELVTARVAYEDYCLTLRRKADGLLAGVEEEQVNLAILLDLQVDYATEYARILVEAKKTLPSSSRNSLMPPSTTRMSRSHSDSALKPGTLPAPARQRSSTLTSQFKIGEEKVKGRSRSGSLLARFVTKKEEDSTAPASNFSLPSVASLKNMVGSSKYNSLGESSSSYSSPTALPRFARSQTSPSSPTFRSDPPSTFRSDPPSKASTPKPSSSPSTRFVARFAFKATEPSELSLEKGEIVRVERAVNDDWWVGVIVDGDGRPGMFPSAFVEELEEDLLMRRSSVKSTGAASSDSDWRGLSSGAEDDESEGESNSLRPNNSSGGPSFVDSTARRAPPPPPPPRRYTSSPFAQD